MSSMYHTHLRHVKMPAEGQTQVALVQKQDRQHRYSRKERRALYKPNQPPFCLFQRLSVLQTAN